MTSSNQIQSLHGKRIELFSPAKLNLALEITGRRSDGYHLLEMLNLTIDFGDTIALELNTESQEITIELSGGVSGLADPGLTAVSENLACRAVHEYFSRLGLPVGARVSIDKSIPLGAGLGGGSSNAASVLKGLNSLCDKYIGGALKAEELAEVALGLGADVPYLLHGGLARVGGIGECIRELDGSFLEGLPIALILPAIHSETAAAFKAYAADINKQTERISPLEEVEQLLIGADAVTDGMKYGAVVAAVNNDLQGTVIDRMPPISTHFEHLSSLPDVVSCLSGSGAAIFAIPTIKEGQNVPDSDHFIKVIRDSIDPSTGAIVRLVHPYLPK